MKRIRRWVATAFVAATVGGAGVSAIALPASPVAAYSALQPPPLCSQAPYPCVNQPGALYVGATPSPILIDMPTMRRETVDPNSNVSGEVTFTIVDSGTPPAGYTMRPPGWANPMSLLPLDAEPTASEIVMYPKGNCTGHRSCTYETTSSHLLPGWYAAGHPAQRLLAGGDFCPPSPNGVYGCGSTYSESALYIPQVTEKEPPSVEMATAGSGTTTKVIAEALDAYGEQMALTYDFGDGTPEVPASLGSVVTHTYAQFGDYDVLAKVRTADGRNASASTSSQTLPPKPEFLSFATVPPPNNGVAAMGTGLVQGWPAGVSANVLMWTTGCPEDPASNDALNTATPSNFFAVGPDGELDIDIGYAPVGVNAAVIQAFVYLPTGDGRATPVKNYSDCMTNVGTAVKTSATTAVGATEIPVDPATAPIGHVVQIDTGANAEWRLVTGHGSLIVGALSKAHAAGAPVVDLGAPVPPFVMPPPPADPVLDGGSGGGGGGTPGAGSGGGGGGGGTPSYVGLDPARLLETRTDPGLATADGQALGGGLQPLGGTVELQVAGRGGVPVDAAAAVLNVTVTDAQGPGFVTVYPCGSNRPNASSLNYGTGSTIANGVIAKVGSGGKVCLFTSNATHLIADVVGYFPGA